VAAQGAQNRNAIASPASCPLKDRDLRMILGKIVDIAQGEDDHYLLRNA
jgi:hypothetical protein